MPDKRTEDQRKHDLHRAAKAHKLCDGLQAWIRHWTSPEEHRKPPVCLATLALKARYLAARPDQIAVKGKAGFGG